MKQRQVNYAVAAYELGIPYAALCEARDIIEDSPELHALMSDRSVCGRDKEAVIGRIADRMGAEDSLKNFLMYLCRYNDIYSLPNICKAYDAHAARCEDVLNATLFCVNPPNDEQVERFKSFLRTKTQREKVNINIEIHPDLIGGFVLQAGDITYDRSIRGAVLQMKETLG
ncbi:MAG: ATP synthase F1 subunit delta [Eubacterium sp.]|nr:ATP synthase F1 subunit delta [Eubacterium sp.]